MRRAMVIVLLLVEAVKHLLSSSDQPFCEVVLERVAVGRVAPGLRPLMLGFVVMDGLRTHAYSAAFRALNSYPRELPWRTMSLRLLRQIFEAAIIFGEQEAAHRSLNELSTRSEMNAADVESLRCLFAWGTRAIRDESAIDLNRTYFVAYPAHDEWFKGLISANTGRLSDAKAHFQKCLALATPEANELREDVMRRMQSLA